MNAGTSSRLYSRPRRTRTSIKAELLESRTLLSAWSTVDTYHLGAQWGSFATAMASDAAGNVYAAGRAVDSSGNAQHAIVREKLSGSASWTTIEDTTAAPNFGALAVDATGDVFVSAKPLNGSTGSSSPGWMILERPAGQTMFSVVDQLSGTAGCNALATDAAGDVLAAGTVYESAGARSPYYNHWVVREWVAGTAGFKTIDDYLDGGTTYATGVTVIASGPAAGIYAVGEGLNSAYHWLVRKSANGGATWSTVDDFLYDPQSPNGSGASAVSADGAGNVYVVGDGAQKVIVGYTYSKNGTATPVYSEIEHWLVRKSGSGSLNSWSVNDDFQTSSSLPAIARAAGVDRRGQV